VKNMKRSMEETRQNHRLTGLFNLKNKSNSKIIQVIGDRRNLKNLDISKNIAKRWNNYLGAFVYKNAAMIAYRMLGSQEAKKALMILDTAKVDDTSINRM
jgi:hypothetical protein